MKYAEWTTVENVSQVDECYKIYQMDECVFHVRLRWRKTSFPKTRQWRKSVAWLRTAGANLLISLEFDLISFLFGVYSVGKHHPKDSSSAPMAATWEIGPGSPLIIFRPLSSSTPRGVFFTEISYTNAFCSLRYLQGPRTDQIRWCVFTSSYFLDAFSSSPLVALVIISTRMIPSLDYK